MTSQLTTTASTYMLPDLVEIQRSSFRWFLEEGLIEELDSFSPITDYTGKLELRFLAKNFFWQTHCSGISTSATTWSRCSRPSA